MRISLAVAALAMAGVGAMKTYGAYTAANMSDSDLLLMENVEALSNVEEESKQPETCYNTVTTKKGVDVLYCSGCLYLLDSTPTFLSGTDKCNP